VLSQIIGLVETDVALSNWMVIFTRMSDTVAGEQIGASKKRSVSPSGKSVARDRVVNLTWFLVFAVASSVYCVTSASRLSATFDETGYVVDGLQRWRTGSYDTLMKWGTMPLPIDLATLPLYVAERFRGQPFDAATEFDKMLPWARATNLLFWWTLLGMGWLCARQIGGHWAGRIAVALLACEPNLLAHAALATTDIAITAMLLAAVYAYRRGRDDQRWSRRVLLPGIWYGIALLAKASALVFGPLCMLAVEIDHRLSRGKPLRGEPGQKFLMSWKPWFDEVLRIVGIGMLVIFVYIGSDWLPEPTFVKWAQNLPQGMLRSTMLWISEHLCIFTNAGEGVIQQIKHNIRGHGAFLLGNIWRRDVWYYFPVVLSIKLNEALLLAPLIVAILRPRLLRNWALISAGFLLLFSLSSHVQIGVRMMFPLVALAIVGFSAALAQLIGQMNRGLGRGPMIAVVVGCIGWTSSASLRVWPNGLRYINDLWGGVENGYLLVSDSNYDWGQGMKELKQWTIEHGGGLIDVWYFGTDPMKEQPPFHVVSLHKLAKPSPETIAEALRGRRIAVSMTLAHGAYTTESTQQVAAYLRGCKPIAKTQTFLIYDFRFLVPPQ
jgi:hypothetical protein